MELGPQFSGVEQFAPDQQASVHWHWPLVHLRRFQPHADRHSQLGNATPQRTPCIPLGHVPSGVRATVDGLCATQYTVISPIRVSRGSTAHHRHSHELTTSPRCGVRREPSQLPQSNHVVMHDPHTVLQSGPVKQPLHAHTPLVQSHSPLPLHGASQLTVGHWKPCAKYHSCSTRPDSQRTPQEPANTPIMFITHPSTRVQG